MMFVRESIGSITEYLEKALSSKTAIGEPMQFGEVTLVPVVDITFGFGAGGGEGTAEKNQGNGGGGGGGARVAAKAIIVIKGAEVSVLPLAKGSTIEKIVEAIPGLLEKLPFKKEEAKPEKKD